MRQGTLIVGARLCSAALAIVSMSFSAVAGGDAASWAPVIEGKPAGMPDIGHSMGDAAIVEAILDEGLHRNQVMDHLSYLCEHIGPRLTGSPNALAANRWTHDKYVEWGLSNVHLEEWGTIGASFERVANTGKVLLVKPPRRESKEGDLPAEDSVEAVRDLTITTLAWTAGTPGSVRGPIVKEPKDEAEFEKVKDSLAGAWVLIQAPPSVGQRGIRNMVRTRYEMRAAARKTVAEGKTIEELAIPDRVAFAGVAGWISTSRDERIWTGAPSNWRDVDASAVVPEPHAIISGEDYDFINSRLADGEVLQAEITLDNRFLPGPAPVYNTIAEIPGTDLADEVVIISAHLDSWDTTGSQGCTDNGTGSAVTLEAARILATVGAKPRRTIRFINWTGEEQGLLGSLAYAEKHADELDRVSAVFVDDGGTNSEGGLQCLPEMVETLAAATAPVNNLFYDDVSGEALNVNIKSVETMRSGGSDHASFLKRGVPGFFWEEVGRADYAFGWHTQHDRFELAIPVYLRQSATCAAVTAYRLACAPALLPRVPLKEETKDETKDGSKTDAKPDVKSDAATRDAATSDEPKTAVPNADAPKSDTPVAPDTSSST
ncbi:MAG: M20/M25/M40 family metallo-hydrolase [Phycisphaerales bacterium]|nr:MAG: M20/M25/M40 family metallo-hydrolase [Phycisphaerales bacterium]